MRFDFALRARHTLALRASISCFALDTLSHTLRLGVRYSRATRFDLALRASISRFALYLENYWTDFDAVFGNMFGRTFRTCLSRSLQNRSSSFRDIAKYIVKKTLKSYISLYL